MILFVNGIVYANNHVIIGNQVQTQTSGIEELVAERVEFIIPFIMCVAHVKVGIGIYGYVNFVEFWQKGEPVQGKGPFLKKIEFHGIVGDGIGLSVGHRIFIAAHHIVVIPYGSFQNVCLGVGQGIPT